MDLMAQLQRAQTLPPGHYDIAKAEAAVQKEYSKCSKLEAHLWDELPTRSKKEAYINSVQVAANLIYQLCTKLNIKMIKMVYFESNEVHPCAAAHYSNGEIHVRRKATHTTTLLHELAHHLQHILRANYGHGDDFCICIQMVYEAYATL